MCKLIDCLSDLSMMDCSGVIGMHTARVSVCEFLKTTPTFDLTTHAFDLTTPTFDSKHPRSLMKGKKNYAMLNKKTM